MSGSQTTPLTDAERVDARRFCGYDLYGTGDQSFQSYRFFHAYGTLEFRLTNMSDAELTQVRVYLGQLNTLEAAIPASADNLDTDKAAVWTHNKNETAQRMRLFDAWRKRFAQFLGVPYGAGLNGPSNSAHCVV